MHDIVNIPAVQIMIGTLPVTALLGWNLIEVKTLRGEIRDLAKKVGELAERVSKIEGKIEGHHVVLEN